MLYSTMHTNGQDREKAHLNEQGSETQLVGSYGNGPFITTTSSMKKILTMLYLELFSAWLALYI